jgi:putative transposase
VLIFGHSSYLLWLSAYIHLNPQTAGLIQNLEEYKWSSYQDYLGLRHGSLCFKEDVLGQFKKIEEYKDFIRGAFEKIKERKELENYLLD